MKPVLFATAIALGVAPCGALAHGDEHGHVLHAGSHDMHGQHEAAAGVPGDPAKASRTIEIVMSDNMRFTPSSITVSRGETVRFVVRNAGQLRHEMVIGTMKELQEHAEMMKSMPEMDHADANMVTVEPGKVRELVWQFTAPGTFDFACLLPGHFQAGMRGTILVGGPMPR